MEKSIILPTVGEILSATKANSDLITSMRAPRGEKTIFAGKHKIRVRTDGTMTTTLPNGVKVKIVTDASGVATQVEEDEALHAIVRPQGIHLNTIRTKEQ